MDEDAGREAFTYVLHSGRTGTVHVEQVLEYNRDPTYLRDLLLYGILSRYQRSCRDAARSMSELHALSIMISLAADRVHELERTARSVPTRRRSRYRW